MLDLNRCMSHKRALWIVVPTIHYVRSSDDMQMEAPMVLSVLFLGYHTASRQHAAKLSGPKCHPNILREFFTSP